MAAHNPTPPYPSPDDELTALLRSALNAEAPREEFVAALAELSEAELQTVLAADSSGQLAETSSSGSGPSIAWATRRTWQQTGRSLVALAIAAVVVLVASVWPSGASYSWASMLQAMESQPWIESATEKQSGEDVHGWFSQLNRVLIVRDGNDVVWNDLGEATQSRYESVSGVLLRRQLNPGMTHSVEKSLLSFLLTDAGRAAIDGDVTLTATAEIKVLVTVHGPRRSDSVFRC